MVVVKEATLIQCSKICSKISFLNYLSSICFKGFFFKIYKIPRAIPYFINLIRYIY